MAVSEQEIQNIVRGVLRNMSGAAETVNPAPVHNTQPKQLMGIFENVEDAIAAAKKAQKEIQPMPLEFREKIIANIEKLGPGYQRFRMYEQLYELLDKEKELR